MIGIESITNSIKNLLNSTLRTPAKIIPGIILICSLARRPGLSCLISFGNVVQDISKQGLFTDKLPSGASNKMNAFAKAIICEVFRSLKEDANIQVALPIGSISFVGTGANAGGPVTVTRN